MKFYFIILVFFSAKTLGQAGILDPSFGNGGKVINSSTGDGLGRTVIVKADGKILVGGEIFNQSRLGFGVFQFNSDGSPDNTFGISGSTQTFISNNSSDYLRAYCMATQDDGKIVLGGTRAGSDIALVRYLSNGTRDSSFGSNGITLLDLGTSQDGITAITILPDTKIIAAGFYLKTVPGGASVYDLALVKFDSQGVPDNSFGTNGKVLFNSNLGGTGTARSIIIQNDGKIIIAARSPTEGYDKSFMLFRFRSNGLIDSSYGTNGVSLIRLNIVQPITIPGTYDYPVCIKSLQDGKVLFGSASINTKTFNCASQSCSKLFFTLIKYDSIGHIDTAFGDKGIVITDLKGYGENINSTLIINQDKIILSGWTDYSGDDDDFALIRLTMNGTIDSSFGINGIVTTDFGFHQDDYLYSTALQQDSKIIVSGNSIVTGSLNSGRKISLARYLLNGITTPVRFINVTVKESDNRVILTWDVSNELNIKEYRVQKSLNGIDFTDVGALPANNISNTVNYYKWSDNAISNCVLFYRICSIENSGKKDFSKIVKINVKSSNEITTLYPNPIIKQSLLSYNLQNDDRVSIILKDINGRKVKYFIRNEQQKSGFHSVELNFESGIPSGMYFIQLISRYKEKTIKAFKF